DMVRLVVENPNPAQLLWGAERLMFFNDAGLRTFGRRWKSMFGRPCEETFPDLPDTKAVHARVVAGERVRVEEIRLSSERRGRVQDGWFAIVYTPVYGSEGTVLGVHTVWSERTRDVLAARRLQIVNRLASAPPATDLRAALEQTITLLADGGDVPFACAYVLDAPRARADLAAAIGVPEGSAVAPRQLAVAREAVWPVGEAIDARGPVVLDDLQSRFPGYTVGAPNLAPVSATLHPLHDE